MGGNAFPELELTRLNAADYSAVKYSVLERLILSNNQCSFFDIVSYRNKTDHGDLDIIWSTKSKYVQPPDPAVHAQVLNAVDVKRNGPVTSLAIPVLDNKLFQVDLIWTKPHLMEMAGAYFAYNDLGNLLGRIYKWMGFKLGQDGLQYKFYNPVKSTQLVETITISTNWQKILEFAAYDYNRWARGFDELEDVFNYAVSTFLASREPFRLDNVNHAARIRDRKRKIYQQFLKWADDPINNVKLTCDIDRAIIKQRSLTRAFNQFPEFKARYDQLMVRCAKTNAVETKFNGKLIGELTGLSGRQLGEFIVDFKNSINGDVVDWAYATPADQIKQAILQKFNQFKLNKVNYV